MGYGLPRYLSCGPAELHCDIPSGVPQTEHQDAFALKAVWGLVLLAVQDLPFKRVDS